MNAPAETRRRARTICNRLAKAYPDVQCSLAFEDPWQCLVSTILSAQCTDAKVNTVTPELFARVPDPAAAARTEPEQIEPIIRSLGLFRNKARSIIAAGREIVERYDGQVPESFGDLVGLPGVGRKTANCVVINAFGRPGIMVDTHCIRVTHRLGLHEQTDPNRIETALKTLLPERDWSAFSHRIIIHGRTTCTARRPACSRCCLESLCPRIGVDASA